MPGYHDKRYTHQAGYCMYRTDDIARAVELAGNLNGPTLMLGHGPPQQQGPTGLDHVPEAGNVGDPELAAALEQAKIPFGVFGHILEAGGRATDLSGKREIKPLSWSETLYVNPGSANSIPWLMNDGTNSKGLASIITISADRKARYEVIRPPGRGDSR